MYIVSSCLAGINCRYNGKSYENKEIINLVKEGKAIPLCPEQLGGLSTPRPPSEIVIDENGNKKVLTQDNIDVTKEFLLGGERFLKVAKDLGIKSAILKSKSPSCGYKCIYDGKFSGNLIKGNGITCDLLLENGIKVYSEDDFK